MLTAALDGLIDRFALEGERLGEVAGGAVLKHSRDRDLTRESVLEHAPRARDARLRRAAGLRHRPRGDDPGRQQDRARADRRPASPAAPTPPPTRRSRSTSSCARPCSRPTGQRSTAGKLRALARAAPRPDRARDPAQRGAAHRPLDGRALRDHGRASGASGAPSRTSSRSRSHQQPRRRLRARLLRGPDHPYLGLERDQNLRPDSDAGELAKLKPVFGGAAGHDDRRQLDAAQRRRLGGAARQRGVGAGARAAGARLPDRGADRRGRSRAQARRAADGAGLRDAADARPRRAGARRTSTSTRSTRRSPPRCCARCAPGRTRCSARSASAASSRSARSTASELNVNGGSLAAGHPFAATGGRIVAALAKQLHERGGGRGVISICAAGGQGVVAILESAGGSGMSDRYAQLVNSPSARRSRAALGLPRPVALERYRPGDPLIDGACCSARRPAGAGGRGRESPRRRGRTGRSRRPRRRCALPQPRAASTPSSSTPRAPGGALQGRSSSTPPGSPTRPSWSQLQGFFHPRCARLAAQRARDRARHAAGGGGLDVRARDRPARARGLHPLARQGGRRARRHRAARLRRRRRRGRSSPRRCASCSRRARPTSPGRLCGSARRSAADRRARLGAPARRQGRARHRRLARDRRGDRRDARRDGAQRRRPRRARGRRGAAGRHGAVGGEALALDITAAEAPAADRRALRGRHRRGRPQRRGHPRPHAREDARRALERADGDQPLQPGAHQRRAARRGALRENGRIVCVSSM